MVNDKKDANSTTEAFEKALKDKSKKRYVLRLYVTGSTSKSVRAIQNIKKICEEHLEGKYELEVIDVYQQPGEAKKEDVIATPTLVKRLPLPLKRFIGDLSDLKQVLVGLDLVPKD
jgi:circadian clock protein KaiB